MTNTSQLDTEQPEHDPGEQRKERAAAGCLLVVAIGVGGAVGYTVPETAYYAAGLLTAAGIRRARAWTARRRGDEQPEVEDVVDIVAALHQLSPAGREHVRLTQLQEATGLPDTWAVRDLLNDAGIPIRAGVRTPGGNGPGVHHDDIPRSCDTPSGSCWCRSGANANTNNEGGDGPGEGLRVDAIGHAGLVIHDPTETRRRHATTR